MFELIQEIPDFGLTENRKLNEYKVDALPNPIFIREKSMDFMIMREVFFHKCYDVELTQSYYFQHYKKRYGVRPPRFIVDAGAHIGLASVYFAQKYPHAQIIAIEPDGENYKLLLKNTLPYSNIVPIWGAVWNKSTQLQIQNRSFMKKDHFLKSAEYELSENKILHEPEVRAYTMDEIIQQYGIDLIDVLKIDIEGAEKALFQDEYERWLAKTKTILIEMHDHKVPFCFKTVMKALSNYDFMYLQESNELKSVLMFLLL